MTPEDFELPERRGDKPDTNPSMPHLQLTQNAGGDVYQQLAEWLFGLEHVEEGKSRVSLPSSRAAWISDTQQPINPLANPEFTHIHTEPGPGSQHLGLPKEDADEVLRKGWGEPHPMNAYQRDFELLMIYAPRDDEELLTVKQIVTRAYDWALEANTDDRAG